MFAFLKPVKSQFLAATTATLLLVGVSSAAWAGTVTIDPAGTTPTAIDPTTGTFTWDTAILAINSDIGINLTTGTATESGNFNVTDFRLGGSSVPFNNVNQFNHYQIYGSFLLTSHLVSNNGGDINAVIDTFTVTLYGSSGGPGNPGSAIFGAPVSSTDPTGGLILGTVNLTNLGTATYIPGTGSAEAKIPPFPGSPSTSLAAILALLPNPAEVPGFWVAPIPFNIDLAGSADSNQFNTVVTQTGNLVDIRITSGGGTFSPINVVPEPASL